jgi:hypothetical protein
MTKHADGVDVAGVEAQEQRERITDFGSCSHLCIHADRRLPSALDLDADEIGIVAAGVAYGVLWPSLVTCPVAL